MLLQNGRLKNVEVDALVHKIYVNIFATKQASHSISTKCKRFKATFFRGMDDCYAA